MTPKEDIQNWFSLLQENICRDLEKTDGKGEFLMDTWDRPGGGGGSSRVITGGNIIEKGGVNFSAVYGDTPEAIKKSFSIPIQHDSSFFATGVSIVIHPLSPMVPIIHMNVRYFEMTDRTDPQKSTWWFGGGIDLTPHYIDIDDARFFHQQLKDSCDKHHDSYYTSFKQWADEYFFIKHRQETRGIGGIFFDYLKDTDDFTKDSRFAFVQTVGETFIPTYTALMKKNQALPYGEKEKEWQRLRRGRYVEFNLVWDRGTKFGLDTDGRTESILMSLPPLAQWEYNFQPAPNSPEEFTLKKLKKGIDWLK